MVADHRNVPRGEAATPRPLTRVRQPQGGLDRTDLSTDLRHAQESDLCRRLRLGKEPYAHLHRRWPGAQDMWPCSSSGAWEVVIPEHHEGYITWDEFMRNQQQIRSNAGWNARMGQPQGAARRGPALLAGLLRCARCGRALQVSYTVSKQHGQLPRYWCTGDRGRQMVRSCITFAGTRVDQEIAAEVLEALRPLGCKLHSMLSNVVRARPTKSGALYNSHFRRHAMKPVASSGSITNGAGEPSCCRRTREAMEQRVEPCCRDGASSGRSHGCSASALARTA
jgi:hypothetical protein